MSNICVFASSSNNLDEIYYKTASELGRLIAINGMNIVYGGSRLGTMYACASQVKANGGRVIGIMPQKLCQIGYSNPEDCSEFIITKGMRERKAKMDEISDGVVALAGGFGTLEEVSEMIVQKQLGFNNKPIVFINTNGFYNNLIKFFDSIISNKFAVESSDKMYYVADTPQDAIKYIKEYNYDNLAFFRK